MKKNLLALLLLSALAFTQAQAQNCDPWIVKAYQELYSRTPTAEECNIKNYNNGSWNSYDELVRYIKARNYKYATNGSCDPWIMKAYQQLYNRTPLVEECSIKNYNNGSWNNYDELVGYILTYQNQDRKVKGFCEKQGYYGRCSIIEFTNDDFVTKKNSCGQAAASTALWNAGLDRVYVKPSALAKSFYDYAPPKITIGGLIEWKETLGTDWRQIDYGLDGYKTQGVHYAWYKGFDELKKNLGNKVCCLIMIDCGTLPQFSYQWGGGHWVVAYGYDATYVYVSNFPGNKLTWEQLRKAWGGDWKEGNLAKIHGKAEMFAAVWK